MAYLETRAEDSTSRTFYTIRFSDELKTLEQFNLLLPNRSVKTPGIYIPFLMVQAGDQDRVFFSNAPRHETAKRALDKVIKDVKEEFSYGQLVYNGDAFSHMIVFGLTQRHEINLSKHLLDFFNRIKLDFLRNDVLVSLNEKKVSYRYYSLTGHLEPLRSLSKD